MGREPLQNGRVHTHDPRRSAAEGAAPRLLDAALLLGGPRAARAGQLAHPRRLPWSSCSAK
eukprot:5228222-Alexandrium_andersonii.AAC.1